MILPIKEMIFRKKYGGDKESSNTRTYKSFFSEKVSKSHFSAENKDYIFYSQSFNMNETSLKMKGEVSSKYHKLARSIMIFLLASKKNALLTDNNSIFKAINWMFLRLVKQNVLFLIPLVSG